MNYTEVMTELESLGTNRTKKRYLSEGAVEPVFGVATGAMKSMRKAIKINQDLAEELYASRNYDAMYFAGVIADANAMTEADYDRWMDQAYCFMLADWVVAVTLSEADIAQEGADKWIDSGEELRMSGGWYTYCWLLGRLKDEKFDTDKLSAMLDRVQDTIHDQPERAKHAMNYFVYTVGLSYVALTEKAQAVAKAIGEVTVVREHKDPQVLNAYESLQKDLDKGRLGFKRKYVRC